MSDVSRIPLAIVGMACRLPGADNLDEYWNLLSGGKSGLGALPSERFDMRKHFDPEKGVRTKSYTALGGSVARRPFDLSRYPIPQWLIEQSADAHLNMCEVAAAAMQHAGWDPLRPPHENVGVYIGHAPPMSQWSRMIYARQIAHTAEFLREVPGLDVLVAGQTDEVIREVVEAVRSGIEPTDPQIKLRIHAYYLPALLSRQFSLNGPAMAFDAACASSLRALGHGARALQLGEIDVAMIGSASYCHADTLVLFSQAQSVSTTGTRPFDDDADGLVAAEGYVLLLVKTLERALADGDRIQSVIRGIGIASDGKGKSLWAPRKEGQMEAIRRAYSDDVKPSDLQYIEMHATSTQVGDSTEMSALVEGIAPVLPQGMRLPVGSAKANVGHTLETAGLASLTKTVLSMQHGVIPPQINLKTLSTKIEWDRIPFFVSREAMEWPSPAEGQPRRAAVNAFGIGGLNVHVVLEEFDNGRASDLVKRFGRKPGIETPAEEEAIAIVGAGAVLPGARTIDRFWDALVSGERFVQAVPDSRWDGQVGVKPGQNELWSIPTTVGGYIPDFQFDWKKHKIPPKQVQTGAPLQYMLLDAADQALQSAGYDKKAFDRTRTGVVVGTMFGSEFGDQLQMGLRLTDFHDTLTEILTRRGVSGEDAERAFDDYSEKLLEHMPALIDETGSFTASTLSSRITKTFDLMGGATAIDSGDASSMAALVSAIHLLRTHECDMMLCASGDNSLSFATFESLARRGRLSLTGFGVPFDTASDGLVPGEGACALLLKRLSDANRDGDKVLAVIRGVGAAASPSLESALTLATERALQQARVRPEDVAAVETAASGVPDVDAAELRAIEKTYGTANRPSPLPVSATSAQFGHLNSASGIVSLLRTVFELEHKNLAGIASLKNLAKLGESHSLSIAASSSPLKATEAEGRLLAGVNALSDAGVAYHVVLERPVKVAPPEKSTPAMKLLSQPAMNALPSHWRIYRLGAATIDALYDVVQKQLEGSPVVQRPFSDSEIHRLAVVARNDEEFVARCRAALPDLKQTSRRAALIANGVFVGQKTTAVLETVPPWSGASLLETDLDLLEIEAKRLALSATACLEVRGLLSTADEKSTSIVEHKLPTHEAVVLLEGTPFEMGKKHGERSAKPIRQVLRRYADLVGTRWDPGSLLDDAAASPETWLEPVELEELRGVAKGAGVTVQSLVCHHLRLLLDGGAGGAHFAISDIEQTADGLLHGFNEDLRNALGVKDCLARSIQFRRPESGIPHVTLGVAGVVGGLSGMNARGISVSVSCRMAIDQKPQPGRLPSSVVHQILRTAVDLASATEIARTVPTSIPCTFLLSHAATGKACLVSPEGQATTLENAGALFATNHDPENPEGSTAHSRHRLARLKKLLGGSGATGVKREQAMAALRDQFDPTRNRDSLWPTMNTVRRVDNQISVVMAAELGKLWLATSYGQSESLAAPGYLEIDAKTFWRAMPSTNVSAQAAQAEAKHDSLPTPAKATRVPVTAAMTTVAAVQESYDLAASNSDSISVCERYVLRIVESVGAATNAASAPGSAFILGDNAVGRSLKQELERQGTTVVLTPSNDEASVVLAAFEAALSQGPIPHLFLVTPHDADATTVLEPSDWKRRRARGVMLPYRICQRWYQHVVEAGLLGQASVTAVTSLGGDFGISNRVKNVEGGALTGLLKGVAMEVALSKNVTSGFRVKMIDAAEGTDPRTLGQFIVQELAGDPDGKELEVGFADGKRRLVRPVVEQVDSLPKQEIPRESVFVVTGGARGVTAVVARELGLRYGLKLHLIGSSPRPEIADTYHQMTADDLKEVKAQVMKEALANGERPADAWSRFEKALEIDRSLRELRAAGVHAIYHGCDVSCRESLGKVLDEVRRQDGPITGVIHGAGFERASRFEKKQVDLVDRTYAAKVDGAANLMELTKNDPLRYFAAFGSVSGRFGGVGQTDYSSANDMLAKLIDWYRGQRHDCGASVFHWHAWDDVGMAVRPESQHIRKLHNIRFMPSLEGANHLIDELCAGLPEGEIAITELQYCREKYSQPAAATSNSSALTNGQYEVPAAKRPLIDRIVELTPGKSITAEITLDPVNDLFLKRHLFKGRPMMPVVVSTEAMAEAAAIVAGPAKQVTAIRDIEIVNGLRFLTDQLVTARVRVTADGDRMQCEFTADIVNRKGILLKPDQPYLRCTVEVSSKPRSFTQRRPSLPGHWNEIWYPDGETVIYHGEEFRCLKRGCEENGNMWGEMIAPSHGNLAGQRGTAGWITPAALVDAGYYGSGVMLWVKYQGVVAIPAGIGGVELGRPAREGEVCATLFHDRGREGNNALYDFTIFGDDGSVIVHVEGYKNVIVAEQAAETMRGH